MAAVAGLAAAKAPLPDEERPDDDAAADTPSRFSGCSDKRRVATAALCGFAGEGADAGRSGGGCSNASSLAPLGIIIMSLDATTRPMLDSRSC